MNTRMIIFIILAIFMVGGLIAGLFVGSIQMALTLPMMSDLLHMQSPQHMRPVTPRATDTMPGHQTAPNILVQDTFQRPDQPLWGATSGGQMWDGAANSAANRTIFSITGTMGQIAHGQGTFNALLGPVRTDAEGLMTASINRFSGGANFGVVLRWVDDNSWYKARLDGNGLSILKRVKGNNSVLGSVNMALQGGVLYKLRFHIVGTTLSAKVWRRDGPEPADWMITVKDNSLASGRVGIRVLVLPATVVRVAGFMVTTANNN